MNDVELTLLLRKVERLTHDYHGYSASAGGLQERRRCVDEIHTLVTDAMGVDVSDYPSRDVCSMRKGVPA